MFNLIAVILLIAFKLLLASKDATSYLLKKNALDDSFTGVRIKRWHRDGVLLDILFTVSLMWNAYLAQNSISFILVQSLLLRLVLFDIAFNYWADLPYQYLGSTASLDKIFSKIFGKQGAFKKSLFFIVIMIILYIKFKI